MQSRLLTVGLVGVVLGAASAGFAERDTHGAATSSLAAAETTASGARGAAARNLLDEQTQTALQALGGYVTQRSDVDGLRLAFHAYYAFREAHPEQVRKPYLYYVDYGLDSRTPRGYVFDMEALKLVDGPFTVAHGRGSSRDRYGVPVRFSNSSGAATSSLGLYLTQESYGFSGHAGGRLYSSVGLRLDGLSGRFNDAARARGVVMHGAPYVTAAGSGRSQGCPAVEQSRARRIIPLIAGGSLVFLYSPNDTAWVRQDPWANAPGTVVTDTAMATPPSATEGAPADTGLLLTPPSFR